tara:strand:+ start:442 stop:1035 length:594 start_codon:yes stop_codon:yes gene_type:complete
MKKILFLITLSIFTFSAIATKPHTDHIRVDIHKSTVKWKGSKITEGHEGFIQIQKGVLMIDHGTLVGGQISFNMKTITNSDIESEKYKAMLEGHLKSDDFFDVDKYPLSTISITKATKTEGNNYSIVADLSIKGITHSITFDAEVDIQKIAFFAKAKIKIDRTKWDIVYNSGNFFKDLGDKLILDEIEFDIYLLSAK